MAGSEHSGNDSHDAAASPPALDFERPIVDLQLRLDRLRAAAGASPELDQEIEALAHQIARLQKETFAGLTRWQVVQLARHPARPCPLEYIRRLFPDLEELHGDRIFGDDPSILGGLATLDGRPLVVLAHARGRSGAEQEARRFGMPRPEGFRKVARLVRLADRLGLPVVTFVDTPGAYPGADAEERGQAQAIAACLEALAEARPPIVACVVGEGGSGGALALAVGDRLLIQEFAVFEVISPEACSSILFRDGLHVAESAEALRLTAPDLRALGLVDEVISEPPGGAHRDPAAAASLVRAAIARALDSLSAEPETARLDARYARLRSYGAPALQRPPGA